MSGVEVATVAAPQLGPVLTGCRILLTAQRRAAELAGALERRGAGVVTAPALGVVPHVDEEGLLRATRSILADPVDVLVVTTGIGLRGWLDAAEAAGLADELVAVLSRVRLVARGPKARGALQAVGLRADWVAESETSAEIADFLLTEGVAGQRIAVQRHGAGDDGLNDRLTGGGAEVLDLHVYEWGPPPDPDLLSSTAEEFARGGFDAVLFTSAPGASAWLRELRRLGELEGARSRVVDGHAMCAAVGPVTAEPLVVAGFPTEVPERWRMGALVRLVVMELEHRGAVVVPTAAGVLRLRARAATIDHRDLLLSASGMALLRRLSRRPGEVVCREELLEVLPGGSTDPHTVEVAVARLREAAGTRDLVRTVVKRGYALGVVEDD